ncbi:hypothetical protein L1987_06989 [Smallanthus sonchifolius]|uniref:Uncharacterized protein n=1 Tax=Smallanthus sonchifolius TaxID=185202 RepID=A0ACB9K012_9ASTR|nr:hypothetical protein L1987_06989 [Smallanthus sonchifolius]
MRLVCELKSADVELDNADMNYEFEARGFQETVVSKPIGAALIAHVIETMPEPVAYSQVSATHVVYTSCTKCTGYESKSQNVQVPLKNMALYSAFMSSYEDFVAGQLTATNLLGEDCWESMYRF